MGKGKQQNDFGHFSMSVVFVFNGVFARFVVLFEAQHFEAGRRKILVVYSRGIRRYIYVCMYMYLREYILHYQEEASVSYIISER